MSEIPTAKDLAWLKEIQGRQLLGRGAERAMPPETKSLLTKLGLVEEKLGRLEITAEGEKALGK